MSNRDLPIEAVISSHNNLETVDKLTRQTLHTDYVGVTVIDDASTDGTVEHLLSKYGDTIRVMAGRQNLGPIANRNRILNHLPASIIHFINGNMELIGDSHPQVLRQSFHEPDVGAVGGLIRNPDGSPIDFYYGPHFSLRSMVGSGLYLATQRLQRDAPEAAEKIRRATNPVFATDEYPDDPSQGREVGFVSKGNMAVPSELFEYMGGFDERYQYVADLDFARRLSLLGFKRIYTNDLEVRRVGSPDELRAKAGSLSYPQDLARLWWQSSRSKKVVDYLAALRLEDPEAVP